MGEILQHEALEPATTTQMGRGVLEGLRFFASLPLAGTGQRERGRFSCINKRIISHPVSQKNQSQGCYLSCVGVKLSTQTNLLTFAKPGYPPGLQSYFKGQSWCIVKLKTNIRYEAEAASN